VVKKLFIVVLFLSLIAIPNAGVSAIPMGVGVLGDSATQPYQCIGRGDATSFTWTEILAELRNVDFGGEPCEPYNQAWSGETIKLNMASQVEDVVSDFEAGHIGRVIIMLGFNDLYAVTSTPDVNVLIATYRTNLQTLIDAGIAPGNILIIDISQENWEEPIRTLVEQINTGFRNLATEKGTAFASYAAFHAELACRTRDGGATYNIGGQIITRSMGDEYHNFRLADGHLGTLTNGILANTVAADFLGLPRMSDAELLSMVNGEVIPSNPPPTCSSTATPSVTPTGSLFPTFTATSTTVPSSTPAVTSTPTTIPSGNTITVGETNILSITYSGNANRLIAQQVTLPQSATIQSLSYYVATAGGQLRLGVYNNSGNNPGTLIAQTAAFTPVVGWNTQPVLAQTLLPAGTYWLAFLPQNNGLAGRVVPTGVGRHYSFSFGALPGTFSNSPTNDTFHFSLYASLTTGAVPTGSSTNTPLPTNTSTFTPTFTATNTLLPTNTSSNTPLPGSTATNTPLPSNTPTYTPLPSNTPSRTPTNTPLPSNTPTRTPTSTLLPSSTPTRTPTASTPGSVITIGETNILSTAYSGLGNRLIAQQVTLSQSATIQSLSYYVSTTGGQLRLGIYNNSGSSPGNLVAETAAFTPVAGWNTQPVITQTLLPAGTYWLAFLPQSNSLAGRVVLSGTGRHYSYTFGALPAAFSTVVTSDAFHFSFYATLLR